MANNTNMANAIRSAGNAAISGRDVSKAALSAAARTDAAPSMQYRVSGIKSYNPRQARKTGRMGER